MDFDIDLFDVDGCSPGFLIILVFGVIGIGISTVLAEHWIFAIALCCLGMTGLFGWLAHHRDKRNQPHRLHEVGAIISILGFIGFSAFGGYEYHRAQRAEQIQQVIEAEAEAKRLEAETQAKLQQEEENRKLGTFKRLKRWWSGSNASKTTEGKTE